MTPLSMDEVLKKAAEDFASREICTPEERWDFNDQREWERTRNYFLEGAKFGSSLQNQQLIEENKRLKEFIESYYIAYECQKHLRLDIRLTNADGEQMWQQFKTKNNL